MNQLIRLFMACVIWIFSGTCFGAVQVFACLPEWAALMQELGGDKVSVYQATNALQDPHRVEARPSLIAKARSADLMVCTGAQLEIGWVPLLQTESGNGRIQPGQPGFIEVSDYVTRLEIPDRIDRSMGDVHPAGNPHIQLDPYNVAKIGEVLTQRLTQIDPANAAFYQARGKSFQERWKEAIPRWEKMAAPLKGVTVVTYHKGMTYLYNWLGMREVGDLEPKPGIPPTAGHLAELLAHLQEQPAKMIVRAAYNEPQAAQWLSERAKIPVVELPFTVGGDAGAKDLFGLYDDTLQRLLGALK